MENLPKEYAMLNQKELSQFHNKLVSRRNEIFQRRLQLDESWAKLQETEVEPEETAKKEKMALALEQLDEQEKREIEAIDIALRKCAAGSYGICEACGESISAERLEAIPWTQVCISCAESQQQGGRKVSTGEISTDIEPPPDYQGMTDAEIAAAIDDKLQTDGRIELEELDISCRNGKIFLGGALPSERKHHTLISIIADDMGLKDIVDNLRIDPLPWQRRDRRQRQQPEQKTEEEIMLQGEDAENQEDGTPISPSDRFVPEKEE
jgi:DnaK suppressor protein